MRTKLKNKEETSDIISEAHDERRGTDFCKTFLN